MAIITVTVWKTRVVNNIVQGPSEAVTIDINDTNNNGLIDPKEWTAAIGGVLGHNAGDPADSALWKGDATGNRTAGYLFGSVEYGTGTNVKPIIDQLKQNFSPIDPEHLYVCFLAGTRLATPAGEVAVEDLRVGDLVLTLDAGPQPVVWIGVDPVDAARLDACPDLRPVKLARGALGPDVPRRAVSVSPQHRVMIRDAGGNDILAAARHLAEAGMDKVRIVRRPGPFTLYHIALPGHHVVLAEGAPMESFYTGAMALRALAPADLARLRAAFPALTEGRNPMTPARRFATRREVLALPLGAKAAPEPAPAA